MRDLNKYIPYFEKTTKNEFSANELAEKLNVTASAVRHWIKTGELKACQITSFSPVNQYRWIISRYAVLDFIRKRKRIRSIHIETEMSNDDILSLIAHKQSIIRELNNEIDTLKGALK